jgi:hypothetical protein
VQKPEAKNPNLTRPSLDKMLLDLLGPPLVLLLVTWTTLVAADFELYRFYDAESLIAGLALSSSCLAAL